MIPIKKLRLQSLFLSAGKTRQTIYQFVTAVQIVISCLSLFVICLVLPIIYNNVQTTIDYVQNEMQFCEKSNYEALLEVEYSRKYVTEAKHSNRTVRNTEEYNGNYSVPSENLDDNNDGGSPGVPIQTECPGCCIPGPPGARGASGTPGKPGLPGSAGKPGLPGISPNQTCLIHLPREPPPCRPCPKGPPGIKGWPGFPGDVGPIGEHGEKGRDGDDGEAGEPGLKGPTGFRGSPGFPGDKGETLQGDVREGPPGDPGPMGPIGASGVPGLPGRNGLTGPQGDRGWPGNAGETGENGYPGPEGIPGAQGLPGQPGTCICQNIDSLIVVGPGPQPRVSDQSDNAYNSNFGSYSGYNGKK